MYIPPELTERIDSLGKRIGSSLAIVRCWKSDFSESVMLCNFRGVVHKSTELLIEVAGTLCAELSPDRRDEVDLFFFINGRRVSLYDEPHKYLIGFGDEGLKWEYNDEGFDEFNCIARRA